jgi:aldehyde:ferredoxin oxidoreductase
MTGKGSHFFQGVNMGLRSSGFTGYKGKLAWVDLEARKTSVEPADPAVYRDYIGGRGVQARLIYEHLKSSGPLEDPLGPKNRIILGSAAPNDTLIPTAGRGSCSFIGTMARSPEPAAFDPPQ